MQVCFRGYPPDRKSNPLPDRNRHYGHTGANPLPVLFPITVSLTVDDFEAVTDTEKEMKTAE